MGKRDLSVQEQNKLKPFYPELFAYRERCFGGFCFDLDERYTFDVPKEEREKFYQMLWEHGGCEYPSRVHSRRKEHELTASSCVLARKLRRLSLRQQGQPRSLQFLGQEAACSNP